MFALGLLSWMYHRPTEGTERFLREKFAQAARPRRGQHAGVPGRARLRRDHRGVRRDLRGRAGAAAPRAPTGRSPATPRWPTGSWPPGQVSGLPVFLGSYPITPASDILHELSKHKRFGVTTFQAEDEIAGVGAALGAAFGGALGVTTTSGPGIALKCETIGLAVDARAAAAGRRRAARRPVDRAAHQDRAGRPAAGDVRPQRRGAGADRRAALARRLLRRRARGRPDRGDLPDAGAAALRRLARQRLRAVADARRRRRCRRSTRRSPPSPTRPDGARVLALPARRRHPRPAVGDPRHARARAPHRRPGEGRRARLHLLRPGQPRPHGPAARRPRSTGSPVPDVEVDDPNGDAERAGARLGLDLRADRRRRPPGAQRSATPSPRRTCATSTRCRPTSARSCAATAGCWSRR